MIEIAILGLAILHIGAIVMKKKRNILKLLNP